VKRTLQKRCKKYPKVHGQTKGGGQSHHRPLEYTAAHQLYPSLHVSSLQQRISTNTLLFTLIRVEFT